MNIFIKKNLLLIILVSSCGKPENSSLNIDNSTNSNISVIYSISNNIEFEDDSLKNSIPQFGDDAPCMLVLNTGKTIYNQNALSEIVDRLLKNYQSVDIVYTYSYGFMRYCKVYKTIRAKSK